MDLFYIILAIIFGGAVVCYIYESYRIKKEKEIVRLLSPKIERLIELSSIKIANREELLNRPLTDYEKDIIADECYSKM